MPALPTLKQKRKKQQTTSKTKSIFAFVKRFSQGFSAVMLLFALAYGISWCLVPAHFPISSVSIKGDKSYLTEEEIRQVVLHDIKKGFIRLKVSTLQRHLLSLPWIQRVDVRKIWPDQLVIRFEEHKPAAYWGEKGILSQEGALLYPDISKVNHLRLPVLQGPEGKSSWVWQQFLVMEETLAPLKLNITHLILAPRGAWHLRLSNGVTVILGTNDILPRLKRFVHAYESHLHQRQSEMAYVDLRYTSGMAIGWRTS